MAQSQQRTALQRGSAASRLPAIALMLFLPAFFSGRSLLVVHAQAAVAEGKGQLNTSADTVRRRAAAFLRGRSARTRTASVALQPSPAEALAKARAQHVALAAGQVVSLNTPWTAVGPLQVQTSTYGLVTGRITSVAIDPNDASGNTVYVGTSGGGVWKSTNAAGTASAVTFHPLTDTLPVFSPNGGSAIPSLSIGALAVQPGGSGVVLAGTGDPNDATDSYYGQGLLRSTDGGSTWSLVQAATNGRSFYGEAFAGFAWSATQPQTVVAALTSSEEAAIVQANTSPGFLGLYYSQDGGANWLPATIQDGSTVVQDRDSNPNIYRGNAATSVIWNPVRQRFYAAVRSHGYYESTDGTVFTRLANQPGAGLTTAACPTRPGDYGSASCPIFRGALAAQPVSGDLFALTVDASNNDGGLWQDACNVSGSACASSTVQWATRIDATLMETSGKIAQGDYNLSLAAVPAATALSMTDTLLFAGTEDLFRCGLSGGCSLRNTTNTQNGCASPAGVAPAQHAIAWQTNVSNSSAPLMVLGNDGGLWRSLDGVRQQGAACSADDKTHFDNLNGALGSLAMVSGFSSHPSDANVLLAALGENGSAASTTAAQAANTAAWAQLSSGESGTVAIDQSTGNNWLVQSGAGVSLHTCIKGTACTATDFTGPAAIGSAQVQGDSSLTDPPALLDPELNTNVIAGTCRVFRGPVSGGSTWSSSSAISRFLGGPTAPACTSSDANIRSLAAGGPAAITSGSQTSGSTVLYAGLAGGADGGSSYGGQLYANIAANVATSTTAWTNVAANPVSNDYAVFNAGGFDISSIAVDPSDATGRTVYATVMGFGYPHLYRSTNAGSTWTNISANLPNAPANSVVVDPNNPLIVYVALDTGVYATTDVTTCVNAATGVTGNCWGVLGTSLPNAPVLSLVASKSVAGGVLRAGTFGRGIWQVPLLSAGQALVAVASFSPTSLTFSAQAVGSASTAQTVTLTNTGNTVLAITSVASSAGFAETDTCSNTSLTVNASCTINVSFSPATTGAISGSVLVYSNVSGGYATLPLSGTGQGVPAPHLSPTSILFPVTPVGATTASQTITVSNTGTGAASLTTPTGSPDFPVTATTCGGTLAPGGTCTVTVAFAPSQNGLEIGTLSLGDGTLTYATQLTGNGTGTASVTASPTSIYFGDFPVSGQLAGAKVYLTNNGNAFTSIGPPSATGDFGIFQNDCPGVLGPGETCSLIVSYGPSTPGPHTGVFNIADGTGAIQTVSLSGDAYAATVSFSPAAITFATTVVGSASAAQIVTVTNTGGTALNLGVLAAAGDFGIASNTCVGTLYPTQICTFSVNFTPTADGPRYGSISLPDSFTVHNILLSGNGHGTPSVAVTPAALSFGTVAINSTSAPQTVTVTNSGTAAIALNLSSISGDFVLASNSCGTSLAAAATCTLTINFTPSAAGLRTGSLTVADAIGTHIVALSGNGVGQAIVTLTPAALTFAPTSVSGISAALTVQISNGGTIAAVLATPVISGDFAVTGSTCGGTLAPLAGCSLSLVFRPTVAGLRSGLLVVADSQGNHTVTLSGNGVGQAVVTLSPAALIFGSTALGGTSAALTVGANNSGSIAAVLASPVVTGDFAVTGNTCGGTLAPLSNCLVSVVFRPTVTGVSNGTLTLTDALGTHIVALSGNVTGQAIVTLTPAALTFATTAVAGTSAALTVVVNNGGTVAAVLASPVITGDFAVTGSTCGATLLPLANCSVSLVSTPTVVGIRTGLLAIMDAQGNHTATLSGYGTTGALTVTPTSLKFADTALNGTTAQQAVVLSNTGNATLAISSALATGDYAATGNCIGTLAAGASCTMAVTFTPTAVGSRTGTLTFAFTGASNSTAVVTLSGNGTGAFSVVLTPASEDFGTQLIGTASAVRNITISNTGTLSGSLGTISVSGDYALTANTCAATLLPQTGCTVSITFTPTATGTRNGILTVLSGAGTKTATLTGVGTAPATDTLSPLSLTFGNTLVNTTSATQTVTLTNSGDTALTLVSAQILAGDFTAVNGCGPTLPARSTCAITVAFVPKSVGTLTGILQVIDVQHSQAVKLTGTASAGPGVSLLPSNLTFATTGVGVVGAAQILTLTNNGGSPLTLSAVTIIGDFGILSGGGTCALFTTVPVGGSCTLSIAFLPSGAGIRGGSIVITSNAPTQTATLTGSGIDFQFVTNGDSTVTIASGASATFPLLLRPLVNTADTVTYTCTGAPANSTCKITSQYSDLSATGTVSLTVLTGTTTAKRIPLAALLLPVLLAPLWTLRRRRLPAVLAALLAVCVCFTMSACGTARTIPDAGNGTTPGGGGSTTITPTGNYTVVASATAAGVTHSVSLTLVVK